MRKLVFKFSVLAIYVALFVTVSTATPELLDAVASESWLDVLVVINREVKKIRRLYKILKALKKHSK